MLNNLSYRHIIKKYVFDILKDRYKQNEGIVDRLSFHVVTEQDVRDFISLIASSYERGYHQAVEDYREQLENKGFKVNIKNSAEH